MPAQTCSFHGELMGMYDVFLSHASEEKRAVAMPIANKLSESGLSVWFDDQCLLIGDSLLESINHGLQNSRYGVVILSRNFFLKDWPRYELEQIPLANILPVLHNMSYKDLSRNAPAIAKKRVLSTSGGLGVVCQEIIQVVQA